MNPFMQAALEEAKLGVAAGDGGPFGAVIVLDGEIIGRGHNMVVSTHDPTSHAEVVAIRNASAGLGRFDLSGAELYTSCEPCPMCLAASFWARISVLYYGCNRDDAAAIGFDDAALYEFMENASARSGMHMSCVDRESCLEAFSLWRSKPDRITY
ncbi:nucleoside deaminase [Salinispira pacifica]